MPKKGDNKRDERIIPAPDPTSVAGNAPVLYAVFCEAWMRKDAKLGGHHSWRERVDQYSNELPVEPFPPFDKPTSTVMRYRTQQSVNLGSWFVHENWMTPSLFQEASGHKVSELDIASGWNCTDCARQVLESHWDTFITYSDFSYLSSIGINTVRLPIGYWSLGPSFCQGSTPFSSYADVYTNSWAFVVRAINMAAEVGIGVLVDLHGAVGSQNGQPHSGISDGHTGLFNDETNAEKTLAVLTFLTEQLSTVTNVVGIQILNEPKNGPELTGFYSRAISTLRQIPGAQNFPFYLHDGFDLDEFSDFVANRTDFVVQDHHSYFVFTPQDEKKLASEHTKDIQSRIADELAKASANQHRNLVVDEWSCALTTQSLSRESDQKTARQNFCMAQLNTYSNATAGWSFWAYKTENCDNNFDWCFTAAVGDILPSDFSDFSGCNSQSSSNGKVRDRGLDPSSQRGRRDSHNTTGEQRSHDRGYTDGFAAAEFFCYYGSRLGFIGQYMDDSIQGLGPEVIAPGTESYYRTALLLFDSRYFWWLASLAILGDFLLSQLIIHFVPYTEIDWETYMVQTEVYLKGESDYSRITGPTGPLVYPAGHLRIHQLLHTLTDAGKNIQLAQQIYGVLYITCLTLTYTIYWLAGGVPNWIVLLLPLSKRLHSIYVLRLFNDCWAVMFVQAAVVAYQTGYDDIGTLLFSAALSVKMSILLYMPALLVFLFRRHGPLSLFRHLITLVASNALLALPFLEEDYWAYLRSAFDLSRVFLFKWTVNWRMLGEEMFLNPRWANGLLLGHVSCLAAFGIFVWFKMNNGVWTVLKRALKSPELPASYAPVTADYTATVFFTANLIGILFARSLHYQFYSWYAQQLPFLAWRTRYPVIAKLALLAAIEYSWNVFPSTSISSTVLLVANSLLLAGIWTGYPNGIR
ncbi:putative dolichyl-phosphate-mannose--glycolipid alpha-mannosyltransferase [Favolaschia claudopus]|uniref:Dol-P-Man:Man(5)GlcNAc(2)-PP-Dol alpha-1,3-mannosyltransferase n=1 Tax=Favolaschia claudopus TaxID=2862362 RepID=A0AAW0AP38_9AGAR